MGVTLAPRAVRKYSVAMCPMALAISTPYEAHCILCLPVSSLCEPPSASASLTTPHRFKLPRLSKESGDASQTATAQQAAAARRKGNIQVSPGVNLAPMTQMSCPIHSVPNRCALSVEPWNFPGHLQPLGPGASCGTRPLLWSEKLGQAAIDKNVKANATGLFLSFRSSTDTRTRVGPNASQYGE